MGRCGPIAILLFQNTAAQHRRSDVARQGTLAQAVAPGDAVQVRVPRRQQRMLENEAPALYPFVSSARRPTAAQATAAATAIAYARLQHEVAPVVRVEVGGAAGADVRGRLVGERAGPSSARSASGCATGPRWRRGRSPPGTSSPRTAPRTTPPCCCRRTGSPGTRRCRSGRWRCRRL